MARSARRGGCRGCGDRRRRGHDRRHTATSGQLTFTPGQTSKIVSVPILGDTAVESDETFTLTLSGAVNANLARATATGTIVNDDTPKAKAGHWHGQVNNGGAVDFDVSADGLTMTNVTFNFTADCQPSAKLTSAVTAASLPINADLSLNASGSGSGFTITLIGNFRADGLYVSGTMDVHQSIDYQGTHYECDSGTVGWAAASQS